MLSMLLCFTVGGRGTNREPEVANPRGRRSGVALDALLVAASTLAPRRRRGEGGGGDQTLSNGGMPPKPRSNGGLPPGGMPPIIHARRHPAESPKIFGGRPPKAFGGIPPDACIYSAASRQQQIFFFFRPALLKRSDVTSTQPLLVRGRQLRDGVRVQ